MNEKLKENAAKMIIMTNQDLYEFRKGKCCNYNNLNNNEGKLKAVKED